MTKMMYSASHGKRQFRFHGMMIVISLWMLGSNLPIAQAAAPNAVTLRYFRAQARPTSVFLEWETGTEVDHGGFNLYRSQIANDPTRGVLLSDEFPPQDEFSGGYYSYTDSAVQVGTTYYYSLVAFDLRGSETVYRSDPLAVTPGQIQPTNTPTATPTRTATQAASATLPATDTPAPTATTAPTTALPTNTPAGVTPTNAPAGPTLATATPTATLTQPSQPTSTPSATATPAAAPVVPAATTTTVAESAAPSATPLLQVTSPTAEQAQGLATPTGVPAEGSAAAETQAAPTAIVSPTTEPAAAAIDLPTRAPRPTPRPESTAQRSNSGALLAVIAALAMGAAALLLAIIAVLWLRSRNSQG